MCSESTLSCSLNECNKCPGTIAELKEKLINNLEENMIENVTYKQWLSVDRCSFETVTKAAEEFVDSFCKQLILKKHSFIARQQSQFFTLKNK